MSFISNFKNASSFENITQYLNKFNAINVLSQEEEESKEEEEGEEEELTMFLTSEIPLVNTKSCFGQSFTTGHSTLFVYLLLTSSYLLQSP